MPSSTILKVQINKLIQLVHVTGGAYSPTCPTSRADSPDPPSAKSCLSIHHWIALNLTWIMTIDCSTSLLKRGELQDDVTSEIEIITPERKPREKAKITCGIIIG